MNSPLSRLPLLGPGSWPETQRITGILRKETTGGVLLLLASAAALIWRTRPGRRHITP